MISVHEIKEDSLWDKYVDGHPAANAYQFFAWQVIINNAYGFKPYALAAFADNINHSHGTPEGSLVGLLPLIQMRSPFIGNRIVSMPYFDHGGVIAENAEAEKQLIEAAIRLGQKTGAKRIELRQLKRLSTLENDEGQHENQTIHGKNLLPTDKPVNRQIISAKWTLKSHKVRMILSLPENSDSLMKSFKSKLRSQIKRPIKAGLLASVGGAELLDDFYSVFSTNMRDLGSPVHSSALPYNVLRHFGKNSRIVLVYKKKTPIAASLMVGLNSVMINPWSSALRQYSKDSPNMLLYWTMLSYAADHGYRHFDFGRSTPDEGTYRFKAQWGAKPHPMYWYTIHLDKSKPPNHVENETSISKKRAMAVQLWQKLPVPITRIIGPSIRKHIDL
jgi:FemAB-related protein (PEP-CTERM system-associated)